jgi:hypothetical protein
MTVAILVNDTIRSCLRLLGTLCFPFLCLRPDTPPKLPVTLSEAKVQQSSGLLKGEAAEQRMSPRTLAGDRCIVTVVALCVYIRKHNDNDIHGTQLCR